MDSNVKIFAIVGTFATVCVTVVSLFAISREAEWAHTVIISGIIGATITIVIPLARHILIKFRDSNDGIKNMHIELTQGKSSISRVADDLKSPTNGRSEKEAENLMTKIIKEQQRIFVRDSYGESATECFTWEDLDRFKQENNIAKVQRNIAESGKFSDLIDMLVELPERRRNDVYQVGRYIFKKTWAELGEITAEGQTDAGQKAEKMIADAIVAYAKQQVQLV